MFESSGADSVFTVLPVPAEYNPHWVFFPHDDDTLHIATGDTTIIPRRQDLPPAFHREGSVYVVRRDVLMNDGSLYGNKAVGHVMSPEDSVNIDTIGDWNRAEAMLATRG
jgi:CMP-N-acetylneuraminic acid synthetase